MRNRLLAIVVTWPFLLALIILLLNDWWLKPEYPNAITGKLSDFAGIAVVGLLLGAIFPRRIWRVALGISVVFLWWKSPLSSSFIQVVNDWLPFRISRTVDYSDLVALCVLPLCHRILADYKRYALPCYYKVRQLLAVPILGVSLLGILGTSMIPIYHNFSIRPADPSTELNWSAVTEAIREVVNEHGLVCANRANPPDCSSFEGAFSMQYSFDQPNIVSFQFIQKTPNLIFHDRTSKKMDALRNSLKNVFATRFPGLEYVEPL